MLVTLAGAVIALALAGSQAAYSVGVGSGISTVVSLYFASRVFAVGVGSPAAKVARAFYLGKRQVAVDHRTAEHRSVVAPCLAAASPVGLHGGLNGVLAGVTLHI